MTPVRLDPADPLASVLRWLAALMRALGIELSEISAHIRLNRAAASIVREHLAEWSRRLRALVRIEAMRLAAQTPGGGRCLLRGGAGAESGSPPLPGGEGAGGVGRPEVPNAAQATAHRSRPHTPQPPLHQGEGETVGLRCAGARAVLIAATRPARPVPCGGARRIAPRPWEELIDPGEQAALRRRLRAVLLALRDPSAAISRLARRLALARAARIAVWTLSGFPRPVRVGGIAPRGLAPAPEPRPPDRLPLASP